MDNKFVNTDMRSNRDLRMLLGTIGLDFPATYSIKPVANKNELVISDKVSFDDVIDYVKTNLKAKPSGDNLFTFKKALIRIIDDSPVRIEIVSKIDETTFKQYLEILLAK